MIKKTIAKKLISKDGYFDRELLVELMEPKRLKRFVVKKFYKKFLRIGFVQPAKEIKKSPKISDLERIGQAYPPINFFSKLSSKFKSR
ncbi:MAG: hypothetical protein KA100_06835 [Rickettsiales bacterium]|nr:hypothetical protein [Rickettsiales bacterium]